MSSLRDLQARRQTFSKTLQPVKKIWAPHKWSAGFAQKMGVDVAARQANPNKAAAWNPEPKHGPVHIHGTGEKEAKGILRNGPRGSTGSWIDPNNAERGPEHLAGGGFFTGSLRRAMGRAAPGERVENPYRVNHTTEPAIPSNNHTMEFYAGSVRPGQAGNERSKELVPRAHGKQWVVYTRAKPGAEPKAYGSGVGNTPEPKGKWNQDDPYIEAVWDPNDVEVIHAQRFTPGKGGSVDRAINGPTEARKKTLRDMKEGLDVPGGRTHRAKGHGLNEKGEGTGLGREQTEVGAHVGVMEGPRSTDDVVWSPDGSKTLKRVSDVQRYMGGDKRSLQIPEEAARRKEQYRKLLAARAEDRRRAALTQAQRDAEDAAKQTDGSFI